MSNRKRGSNASGKILTAVMFLGKDNVTKPYIKPATLLTFMDNARPEDIDELETFFKLIRERLRMLVTRRTRNDREGKPYLWCKFLRAMAEEGVKCPILDDILRFIEDYQNGKVIIDFDLDDLVTEAEKG